MRRGRPTQTIGHAGSGQGFPAHPGGRAGLKASENVMYPAIPARRAATGVAVLHG